MAAFREGGAAALRRKFSVCSLRGRGCNVASEGDAESIGFTDFLVKVSCCGALYRAYADNRRREPLIEGVLLRGVIQGLRGQSASVL